MAWVIENAVIKPLRKQTSEEKRQKRMIDFREVQMALLEDVIKTSQFLRDFYCQPKRVTDAKSFQRELNLKKQMKIKRLIEDSKE